MCIFGSDRRLADYLIRDDVAKAAEKWFHSRRSFAKFLTRYSEDDAERIIAAYINQSGASKYDPISDAPEHAEIFKDVEVIISSEFPERHRGLCCSIWRRKKILLEQRGISWLSPADLNPFNRYD